MLKLKLIEEYAAYHVKVNVEVQMEHFLYALLSPFFVYI